MSRKRGRYPAEYRQQMVDLVRSGSSPDHLAREFEPSGQTIRNWIRQTDRAERRRSDGTTTAEREELRRLRREVHRLHETGTTPGEHIRCPRTEASSYRTGTDW